MIILECYPEAAMKKRIQGLSLLILCVFMISLTTGCSSSGNEFEYIENAGQITITAYNGNAAEVTIPDKISGKSVTSIGKWAFLNGSSLKSITIPEGVTSIGEEAFLGCSVLTDVTLPDSLMTIGNYAFLSCYKLPDITIPANVTRIGSRAFDKCSMSEIYVSPENPYYASESGILYSKNMTKLIFCPQEKSGAIELSGKVTSIGDEAFLDCTYLTSITMPEGLVSIGAGAFTNCGFLEEITIPDSVTSIGQNAFERCSSLMSITIPIKVSSIGTQAFSWCWRLTEINVSSGNENFMSEAGILYNKDKTRLIACPAGKSEPIEIPGTVTFIGDYAFLGAGCMTDITLPEGVRSIGIESFSVCSLDSITLPDSLVSIGDNAFFACDKLKDISIPSNVTYFGWNVFGNCDDLVIQCREGTAAQSYAVDYEIAYEIID